MKTKFKILIFFIFISSFFSLCLAEDFWMKLGWDESTSDIFYTCQDEIYINSHPDVRRSFDKGVTWENYPQILGYSINWVDYISEDGNYLYASSVDYLDSLCVVHKDSSNLKPLLKLDYISLEKCKDNFYFLGWCGLIKAPEDLRDTTLVIEVGNWVERFQAIIANSIGTLFAGSTDFTGDGGIYKSFDNGVSWEWHPEDLSVHTMSVDSEGRIFAGCYDKILRSIDNGETWQNMQDIIAYPNCMLINSDDEIFMGFSADFGFKGIGYSDDNGDTWSFLNEGLEETTEGTGSINDIAISPDGYVYLATDGGVYRSINSTGIEDSNELLAMNYELEQNYPNPFNPTTQISYALSQDANVSIKVYNSNGSLVADLVNTSQSVGYHNVVFDASKLSNGIFYYTLVANGNMVSTKKMLLIK